jgi:hypothetical protein
MRWLPVVLLIGFIGWITWQADKGEYNFFIMLAASFPNGDKVGHLLIYLMLAVMLNVALQFRRLPLGPLRPELGSLLVWVYTMLEETSQLWFASRNFEWLDVLANTTGVLLASLICRFGQQSYNKWKSASASKRLSK